MSPSPAVLVAFFVSAGSEFEDVILSDLPLCQLLLPLGNIY